MLAGELPDELFQVKTVIYVNNVERGFTSLTVDQECSGVLPSSLSGSGIRKATGTIEWSERELAQVQQGTPWTRAGGFPPAKGDKVRVVQTVGSQSWTVFSGVVAENKGGHRELTSSSLVDGWGALDRSVTFPAQVSSMPGVRVSPTDAKFYQLMDITSFTAVYMALWNVEKGILPRRLGRVQADFQASVYPIRGGYDASWRGRTKESTIVPGVRYHEGALYREHWLADAPRIDVSSWNVAFRAVMRESLVPWISIAPEETGALTRIWLRGDILAMTQDDKDIAVINLPNGTNNFASVFVTWSGTSVTAVVDGKTYTATSSIAAPNYSKQIRVGTSMLAAFNVDVNVPQAEWDNYVARVNPSLTYNFQRAAWAGGVPATREVYGKSAQTVIEDFADSAVHATWIDGNGLLQIRGADRMLAQSAVKTLTAEADILDYSWVQNDELTRSGCKVTFGVPSPNMSTSWRIPVWQGSQSGELQAGDTVSDIAESGSDTDWIEPDLGFGDASQTAIFNANAGEGSFWAAVQSKDSQTDNASWSDWGNGWVNFTAETLGMNRVKVTHKVNDAFPDDRTLALKTPGIDTTPWTFSRFCDMDSPVIRARGEVKWSADSTTTYNNNTWATIFEHDASHWVAPENAGALAGFIAQRLLGDSGHFERIPIFYDPRLELGDKVFLNISTIGVSIGGIISGLHRNITPDGCDLELDIQVISSAYTQPTYEQLEAFYEGKTYQQFESIHAGETYQQFEDNPLKG